MPESRSAIVHEAAKAIPNRFALVIKTARQVRELPTEGETSVSLITKSLALIAQKARSG